MASIGQLVKAVAQTSGLEEASVKLIARYIREAGYIGQQSTGAGAARMTSADAAALLIAVNCSDLAKDAVEFLKKFYELPVFHDEEPHVVDTDLLLVSRLLSRADSFGACLASLIGIVAGDGVGNIISDENKSYAIRITIGFKRPQLGGNVFVYSEDRTSGVMKAVSHRVFYLPVDTEEPLIDRSTEIHVSRKTIDYLARTIKS